MAIIPVYLFYQKTFHNPLALGSIVAYAKKYNNGELNAQFKFIRYYFSDYRSLSKSIDKFGEGIILFSDYVWNFDYHVSVSKRIKEKFKSTLIIHGGPSVPNYDHQIIDFVKEHREIDINVHSEGEITFVEILSIIKDHGPFFDRDFLRNVNGISFYSDKLKNVVKTLPREKAKNLEIFPSAYEEGMFDIKQKAEWVAAIVETNRGCPYGCTFCDWGIKQKIRQFPIEKVKYEIEWIAKNKIDVIWITDANYGIFSRDLEISQHLADMKLKYGYPKQVFVNYAKNSTERLAKIIKIFTEAKLSAEGIISIQTRDEDTLRVIDRNNIKNEKYDELLEVFKKENLPIATDLMLGLPGSTIDSLAADLQYFFERQTHLKVYGTQLLPNTPMASPEYLEKFKITLGKRGFLNSSYSYSVEDHDEMIFLYKIFHTACLFGIIKFFLYYLQLNHGLKALDILRLISKKIREIDYSVYPYIREVFNVFTRNYRFENQSIRYSFRIFGINWKIFFNELFTLLKNEYNLEITQEIREVSRLQIDLIPALFKGKKIIRKYQYNFHDYFQQCKTQLYKPDEHFKPLADFKENYSLEITDSGGLNSIFLCFRVPYDLHRIYFELNSELRIDKSETFFVNFAQDKYFHQKIWEIIKASFHDLKTFIFGDAYSPLGNIKE